MSNFSANRNNLFQLLVDKMNSLVQEGIKHHFLWFFYKTSFHVFWDYILNWMFGYNGCIEIFHFHEQVFFFCLQVLPYLCTIFFSCTLTIGFVLKVRLHFLHGNLPSLFATLFWSSELIFIDPLLQNFLSCFLRLLLELNELLQIVQKNCLFLLVLPPLHGNLSSSLANLLSCICKVLSSLFVLYSLQIISSWSFW